MFRPLIRIIVRMVGIALLVVVATTYAQGSSGSSAAQQARAFIAHREGVPQERLRVVADMRRAAPLLNRSFQAVTVVDPRTGRFHTVFIDHITGQVEAWQAIEAAERQVRDSSYGKLQPALYERLQRIQDREVVPVLIWAAALNQEMTDPDGAIRNALAAKYPAARAAMEHNRKPMDVDDPMLSQQIEAEYTALRRLDNERRVQPLLAHLQAQGYTVHSQRGIPTIRVSLRKQAILALAHHPAVGMIYLAGRTLDQHFMDPGLESDRIPNVRRRGNIGAGVSIAVVEDDNVDFDEDNNNPAGPNAECPPGTHNCFAHFDTRNSRPGERGFLDEHATLVASVAASNNRNYEGVAPGATILSAGVQASTPEGVNINDFIAAMNWAVGRGADVFNIGQGGCAADPAPEVSDKVLDHFAQTSNRLVIVASGDFDSDTPACTNVAIPGRGWNVLTVGAYDDNINAAWADDFVADFSSYKNPSSANGDHEKPEVVAPGETIEGIGFSGTVLTDRFATSGTSFSAPQVAGEAALLIHRNQNLRRLPEALRAIIMTSAVHNIEGSTGVGQGIDHRDGVGGIDADLADFSASERGATRSIAVPRPVPCQGPCWWAETITSCDTSTDDKCFSGFNGAPGYRFYEFKARAGERIRFGIAWSSRADCQKLQQLSQR